LGEETALVTYAKISKATGVSKRTLQRLAQGEAGRLGVINILPIGRPPRDTAVMFLSDWKNFLFELKQKKLKISDCYRKKK